MEFMKGCNAIIAGKMKTYSDRLKEIDLPTADQCASAEFDISYTLIHNVILMEACYYTMKFVAVIKRKNQQEKKLLEDRIEMIQK